MASVAGGTSAASVDDELSEALRELYYDPRTGLQGKQRFWQRVQRALPPPLLRRVTKKQVDAWVGKQALSQVTGGSTFRGFYKILAPPRSFQIDVMHLPHATSNGGVGMHLLAVDIMSRFMVVVPIKRRKADMLVEAVDQLVTRVGRVARLEADAEFDTKAMRAYCDKHNIPLLTSSAKDDHVDAGNRLGVVDAATRTLKRTIRNYQVASDTLRYIDALPDIVEGYNDTPHSALRLGPRQPAKTPTEAWENERFQAALYDQYADHNVKLKRDVDIEVGTRVRRRVDRGTFDKENVRWSDEVYEVVGVTGNKYRLAGERRAFKYFELKRVVGEVQGTAAGARRLAAAAARAKKSRVVARALNELK